MKKRDTVTYELKQGNKVVYVGITNDRKRREQQHREEGKEFSRMQVTSRNMTVEGARKKEAARLATYCKHHRGKSPKYNEVRVFARSLEGTLSEWASEADEDAYRDL